MIYTASWNSVTESNTSGASRKSVAENATYAASRKSVTESVTENTTYTASWKSVTITAHYLLINILDHTHHRSITTQYVAWINIECYAFP